MIVRIGTSVDHSVAKFVKLDGPLRFPTGVEFFSRRVRKLSDEMIVYLNFASS